ncbi:uncharacterized protein [Littorina saxatilis]|uniref:uncharacterized protein n=1 Tax=Littorina saxatilis TaxID=31220 RepID=UPI0038B558F6
MPLSWPASEKDIAHFVAHLSLLGRVYSTVRTYLSGISSKHKLNGWSDPTEAFLVKKLLKGLARLTSKKDSRFPITFNRLKQIVAILPVIYSSSYEAVMYKAAFTVAFFGFLRISEIVGQEGSLHGGRLPLQLNQINLNNISLQLWLHASKTDQSGQGCYANMTRVGDSPDVCPVLAMQHFLVARPNMLDSLFIHFDGSCLTRYKFQAVLKKATHTLGWGAAGFSSHSFRIGAATTAAINAVPMQTIMQKGRWLSLAVRKYVRPDKA